MQKIAGFLIAALLGASSVLSTTAYGHGGGGKGRKIDCATLALMERNATGGKLPSKDMKKREKIRRKMQKQGCVADRG
ncbi:hypothetical protein [Rhizobium mesoamericanum]|uniref:Uncharacterized protein n=1 Tax=Rhizobium mesoamericanum STM3625 TaxID=1211777 RepID=K0PXV1_9HYPH|nr:hypothetical protein [Rhizobium mesoamericanum]CCM76545.1 exported hypothetical protein [Rhizobium mesoamericanum STM3625]